MCGHDVLSCLVCLLAGCHVCLLVGFLSFVLQVSSVPGKKTSQVLVQGNVVAQLASMLKESYGVPAQFIQCIEGKGKKGKGRR